MHSLISKKEASTQNNGSRSFFSPAFIQTKLTIGQPNDKYEQEADNMADQVMRMSQNGPAIQTQCAGCEAEEKMQPKRIQKMGMDEEKMQTKALMRKAEGGGGVATQALSNQLSSTKGGGSPLPNSTNGFMSNAFDNDFSNVKVHTDGNAVQMNQGLNARAFTHGSDIYFNKGEYSPNTSDGKRLLAHELTHVVQQGGGEKIQRLGGNPGCTAAERRRMHQAIFNARGWMLKALRELGAATPSAKLIRSLRRNFGPTYGVTVNIPLIRRRVRRVYREISTIPFSCDHGVDPICVGGSCGFSVAGSHAATICSNTTIPAGGDFVYAAGCVLHESFHAAFSNFTVDEYSGWHGHSGSTPTFPGTGTDPLLNADSYTTLIMDLS